MASIGASSSLLGSNTSIASRSNPDTTNASTSLRYRLQDGAARLLPLERVHGCMRRLLPDRRHIDVMYNPGDSTSHYSGCVVCGSVWSCPVCAARISEVRRRELTAALARTDKHAVLVTYTIRHHKLDSLPVLLDALLGAYRFFKSGRWFKNIQAEYSWFGSVRALETTHGSNGWHPHIHELVLLDQQPNLEQLQHLMRFRWMKVLQRFGLECDYHIGLKIVDDSEYVREYVAKFGREPLVERGGKTWRIEHEVAKANVKRSRDKDGGRSPFQLLYDYVEVGDKQAGALFVEYVKAFRGRNQLVWSRGLKNDLGIIDMSDDEVAQDSSGSRSEVLIELNYFEWQVISDMGVRGALLEVARTGDVSKVREFVDKVLDHHKANEERKKRKKSKRS